MARLCIKQRRPKRASLPSTEPILLQVQSFWDGYVTIMEYIRISKTVFFRELHERKCNPGAHKKSYKDQLKRRLAQIGINYQSWQQEDPQTETVGALQ